MTKEFTITIASNDTHEKLVAEIHYGGEEVALVSQDDGLRVELYGPLKGKYWDFDLEDFQAALEHAKKRLSE